MIDRWWRLERSASVGATLTSTQELLPAASQLEPHNRLVYYNNMPLTYT